MSKVCVPGGQVPLRTLQKRVFDDLPGYGRVDMSGYGELVATNDLTSLAHTARLDVLFTGYAADRVAGTVSLIRDGDRVIVVDPGMVPARAAILDPLEELGVSPLDV